MGLSLIWGVVWHWFWAWVSCWAWLTGLAILLLYLSSNLYCELSFYFLTKLTLNSCRIFYSIAPRRVILFIYPNFMFQNPDFLPQFFPIPHFSSQYPNFFFLPTTKIFKLPQLCLQFFILIFIPLVLLFHLKF